MLVYKAVQEARYRTVVLYLHNPAKAHEEGNELPTRSKAEAQQQLKQQLLAVLHNLEPEPHLSKPPRRRDRAQALARHLCSSSEK